MHYGHELQFGTFITPTNDPPHTPVRLAELTEAVGYDLVTFQDHPYQPRFHDTSTLLAWVAARTERVHLSANVTNLPLEAASEGAWGQQVRVRIDRTTTDPGTVAVAAIPDDCATYPQNSTRPAR